MSVLALYCLQCRSAITRRVAPPDKIVRADTYASRLQAADILDQAHRDADAVREEARRAAAACIAAADSEAATLRATVLAAERDRAALACLAQVQAFQAALQAYADALAPRLLNVVCDAMRMLIDEVPPNARVRAAINAAFSAALGGGPMHLHVHPDDRACAVGHAGGRAVVSTQSGLARGSCRLSVGQAEVLADLDLYLTHLKAGMQSACSEPAWLAAVRHDPSPCAAAQGPPDGRSTVAPSSRSPT